MKNLFLVLLLSIFIISCTQTNTSDGADSTSVEQRLVRKSKGRSDELLVVCDSELWNESIGETFRALEDFEFPVCIKPEKAFKSVRYTTIDHFSGSNLLFHNIVVPIILSDQSPTSQYFKDKLTIEDSVDFQIVVTKDVYALNQQVTYVFAKNREVFLDLINPQKMFSYLSDQMADKLSEDLFDGRNREAEKAVLVNLDAQLTVPRKYEVVVVDSQFCWLRQSASYHNSSVFIYKDKYTEQPDLLSLVKLRDRIGETRIFGNQDSTAYMMTSLEKLPVCVQKPRIDHFVMEMRGLWHMKKEIMGGSFISYALIDKEDQIIYYIEGFVFAPNEDKAQHLKEFQAILNSFTINEYE